MTTISTEGTPVALTSGGGTSSFPISISGHLLLVLRDNAGNEFVIRGGPSSSTDGAYGPLILQINEPIGNFSGCQRAWRDGNLAWGHSS